MKIIIQIFTLKLFLIPILLCTTAYCQDNLNGFNPKIKIIEDCDKFTHFADILSLKEFEDKVVYIDFWVTGCKPCVVEFKQLPELKDKYKNEDVVFLYLARSYGLFRVSKWKKEMKKYNLEGYHIYMTEDFKDGIRQDVPGLGRGYPKFILLNKKGDVAYPNAPRPSSGNELYKLIDSLLVE